MCTENTEATKRANVEGLNKAALEYFKKEKIEKKRTDEGEEDK